ncbi:unnamed protein product [Pleuronectes platessa]|uniref:Uncharacterized protein n=1 Tax=Pleuronectes platessa TaxID=8262 RepID=A0A9N7Z460_PLEPL|nr:unnamed protein product [Pleuronectes platessa]
MANRDHCQDNRISPASRSIPPPHHLPAHPPSISLSRVDHGGTAVGRKESGGRAGDSRGQTLGPDPVTEPKPPQSVIVDPGPTPAAIVIPESHLCPGGGRPRGCESDGG